MLRLVRVTETTVTDVLVDVQEGQDPEEIVTDYQNEVGVDSNRSHTEWECQDITGKFEFASEETLKLLADLDLTQEAL